MIAGFSENDAKRIAAAVRQIERSAPDRAAAGMKGTRPRSPRPGADVVKYGTATADWTSGNSVTLTPCVSSSDSTATGEANVDCYIVSPSGVSPINADITSGDIIAYVPFNQADGNGKSGICVNIMFGTYSSVGTTQYQVYQMTNSTTAGWDWVRAH